MSDQREDKNVVLDVTEPTKRSFRSKADSAENNPCVHEANLTFKCLSQNNYDGDACKKYQENYNLCKTFWSRVYRDRRQRNLFPLLPLPSQREAIKKQYNLYGDPLPEHH